MKKLISEPFFNFTVLAAINLDLTKTKVITGSAGTSADIFK